MFRQSAEDLEPDFGPRRKPFSPQTLADHWGVSEQKIRSMCHRRELAFFRIGNRFRIAAKEVDRWEKVNTQPARAVAEAERGNAAREKTASLSDAMYLMKMSSIFNRTSGRA